MCTNVSNSCIINILEFLRLSQQETVNLEPRHRAVMEERERDRQTDRHKEKEIELEVIFMKISKMKTLTSSLVPSPFGILEAASRTV